MPKKQLLILLVTLFFGIIVGRISKGPFQPAASPVPSATSVPQASNIQGAIREKVTVGRVIDGDTIELTDGRKVRYIGINTPETVDPGKPLECFGKEASDKNRELVMGKEAELEKDVSETDRYGRLLRYVYVFDQDVQKRVMVNERMVEEGFAHSSSYPPDIKYQESFRDAEAQARQESRGLWGACPYTSQEFQNISGASSTPQASSATSSIPETCLIKGNISGDGEKIYHLSQCGSYEKTSIDEARGERWFCSEKEAVGAGWRKAKNCP